jgi:DNA polymerase
MVVRRRLAPHGYPAVGETTYAGFRTALAGSGCGLCPLAAGRTNIVVDRGDHRARILLVGEAPGADEDRQGLAFVGRSGKLLDAMLVEAGLDPAADVLIANVVKCRPPGNRPPTTAEATSCLPFLHRQMELAGPRVIVLLGATAFRRVLPGERGALTERAGRLFPRSDRPGIDFLVTFHPAYVLRSPGKRPLMVSHLRVATQRLAELTRQAIPLN